VRLHCLFLRTQTLFRDPGGPQRLDADGPQKDADKLVERGYVVFDTSAAATQRLRDLATDKDTPITVPETFDVGEQAESEGVWTGYHRN